MNVQPDLASERKVRGFMVVQPFEILAEVLLDTPRCANLTALGGNIPGEAEHITAGTATGRLDDLLYSHRLTQHIVTEER